MAIAKLKPLSIKKLKKPGKYSDGGGLYLAISKAGNKTWSYFLIDVRVPLSKNPT